MHRNISPLKLAITVCQYLSCRFQHGLVVQNMAISFRTNIMQLSFFLFYFEILSFCAKSGFSSCLCGFSRLFRWSVLALLVLALHLTYCTLSSHQFSLYSYVLLSLTFYDTINPLLILKNSNNKRRKMSYLTHFWCSEETEIQLTV